MLSFEFLEQGLCVCRLKSSDLRHLINELVDFNFFIYFKLGAQNAIDGGLSSLPIKKKKCKDQYSETCTSLMFIFDGTVNLQRHNVIINSFKDFEAEILYSEGNNKCTISKYDTVKA